MKANGHRQGHRQEDDEGRFRYSESRSGPIVKHQWPLVFDLIEDPSEARDLIDLRLD